MREALLAIQDRDVVVAGAASGLGVQVHRRRQQDRAAEAHLVVHRFGQLVADVGDGCRRAPHPVRDGAREAECLGRQVAHVNRVAITRGGRIVADLTQVDRQHRVRRRRRRFLGRGAELGVGEARLLLREERADLLAHQLAAHLEPRRDVDQQPLAVLTQIPRLGAYREVLGHRDLAEAPDPVPGVE